LPWLPCLTCMKIPPIIEEYTRVGQETHRRRKEVGRSSIPAAQVRPCGHWNPPAEDWQCRRCAKLVVWRKRANRSTLPATVPKMAKTEGHDDEQDTLIWPETTCLIVYLMLCTTLLCCCLVNEWNPRSICDLVGLNPTRPCGMF
jgi:hypothetical protein